MNIVFRKKAIRRPIDRIEVAKPCDQDWQKMEGDDQVRHCLSCKMNVYNLSDMSDKEIYRLVREKEGRLCIKILKRPDGTLVTDNCPRALRAARNRMRLVAASVIAMLVTVGLIQSAQAQGIVGASPIQGDFGRRASDLMPEPASIWPDLLLRSFFCGVIALCTVTALPASKWLDWGAGRKFCVLFLATAVPTAIFLVLASTNHQLVPGGGL